jgi:hypothetical protein
MSSVMEADPFEQPYWNLDQYLIWLASRDNAVEAAYRRGDLFEKRRRLMEAWAEFCGKS